jgi:hypothetical protein
MDKQTVPPLLMELHATVLLDVVTTQTRAVATLVTVVMVRTVLFVLMEAHSKVPLEILHVAPVLLSARAIRSRVKHAIQQPIEYAQIVPSRTQVTPL